MKWLKNIFKRKTVALPLKQTWTAHDQKSLLFFLKSSTGHKLIEDCRHKLFSEHLDACQTSGNAESVNAAMKGANNILSHILTLSNEESISEAPAAQGQLTSSGLLEPEISNY